MPVTIHGEECLNIREITLLLGWSYQTVKAHLDAHDFQYWRKPGKGRAKYYRKSDAEKLKEPQASK